MNVMRRIAAVITATALLGLPAVAPPAQADPAPFTPATVSSWTQSLELFTQLEQSAFPSTSSSEVGMVWTDAVGWALSAIGMAVSADGEQQIENNLQAISSSLNELQGSLNSISAQLSVVQAEIAAISQEEAWATCAEITQTGSAPLAVIQAAADEYNQFITQTNNASASEPAPQVDDLASWAQAYAGAGPNLLSALEGINDMLLGTPGAAGSLSSCAAALYSQYKGEGLNFEQGYYGGLYQYLSYWYQMQVLGLNLYIEAQHTLALDAAGDLSGFNPTQPSLLCTTTTVPAVSTACDDAAAGYTQVWNGVRDQLFTAGAPYIWGSGGAVTAPAVGNKAWVVDINDFQSAGCSLPLTSNSVPCGGTVGTTGGFSNSTWGPFSWGQYSGWQPAATADWLSIFPSAWQQQSSGYSALSAMISLGFGDSQWGAGAGVQDLLIYTGELTSSATDELNQYDYQNTVAGMCLWDTAAFFGQGYNTAYWVRPLCDSYGGGQLAALVSDFDAAGEQWFDIAPAGSGTGTYWGGGNFTDGRGFYDAQFIGMGKKRPWAAVRFPGWLTETTVAASGGVQIASNQPVPQYRWPVLPLRQTDCTVQTPLGGGGTMSMTTSTGAYTMCGTDFATWLSLQMPPAPPPVAVAAAPALSSARVSWRPTTAARHVSGYRIRGQRKGGEWRTMVASTSAQSRRLGYPVAIKRAGMWRFKVVTLVRGQRSKASSPSRWQYVAVKKHRSRYYTFRRGTTTRVAKAFADGRVYFVGRSEAGQGMAKKGRVLGYRGHHRLRWDARWRQPVSGSWRTLRWDGWVRADGPARTRKGMPLRRHDLPRW